MLQSLGLQGVGHNLATEQQQNIVVLLNSNSTYILCMEMLTMKFRVVLITGEGRIEENGTQEGYKKCFNHIFKMITVKNLVAICHHTEILDNFLL